MAACHRGGAAMDGGGVTDAASPSDAASATDGGAPGASLWVSAYYAGWQQSWLPVSEIDTSAFTHLIHFSVIPAPDGSIVVGVNGLDDASMSAVVSAVHAAGKKALLSVGGWNSATDFRQAMAPAVRADFVANLVALASSYGYDGVDLDMEPIDPGDWTDYSAFVTDLRAALDATGAGLLLTAAVGSEPNLFASLQQLFDQINVMTYDLSGAWPGWETWHNSPLYDGGLVFASTGAVLPSCDGRVGEFVVAGVARAKLGIGIDFYGYVWHGATGPNQDITGVWVDSNVPYHYLMDTWGEGPLYNWHDGVEAPYLSVTSPEPLFISYDDVRLCGKKIDYVRAEGLGGVIIWELGGGYRPAEPPGSRDPLLQAVRAAAFGR